MKIIVSFLFLFSCFACFCQSDKTPSKKGRPNIVFMLADDWSFPHAGIYGDEVVRTPTFDRISKLGSSFTNAYCAAPSCSPSRASILTSRYPHQLEDAGNLWSIFPSKFDNWMSLLEEAGYHTGKTRKGWAPGDFEKGGYMHNPAGKDHLDFSSFLDDNDADGSFAFWFGSQDPHRTYEENAGVKTGMDANNIAVPDFLPDLDCVRNDLLDYYYEVERFDRECGNILKVLEKRGLLDNTIIVMTSDNGMPFPRAKANLYDYGTRMPLAMYWKGHIEGGLSIDQFVNFIDFGPTFLTAAGVAIPKSFEGQDIQEIFSDSEAGSSASRDRVFLERERHANVRKGDLSYPIRAIRTKDYLYMRNYEPTRWPAGDPEVHRSVGQFGDVDNSISKYLVLDAKDQGNYGTDIPYFNLSFSKRPYEEFYVIADDKYNIYNQISNSDYQREIDNFRKELDDWMSKTGDRRSKNPNSTYWDEVLYTPKYQHTEFDLQSRIEDYNLLKREGNRLVKSECKL